MSGIVTGAAIAARISGARALLARLPRDVWIALAVVALVVAGVVWHRHEASAALDAARAGQKASDEAAFAKKIEAARKQAQEIRRNAERLEATIAALNRRIHDEQVRDNAAHASALLMRGPGAATSYCRPGDHPAASAGAGRRDASAPLGDASGPRVSPANGASVLATGEAEQWAVVPWTWLVTRAQEHDDLLATEETRRRDGAQQRAAWERMRSQPPEKAP